MNWNELNWNASSFAFYSPCNATKLRWDFSSIQFSCIRLKIRGRYALRMGGDGGVGVGLDEVGFSRQTDASSSSGNNAQRSGRHRVPTSTWQICTGPHRFWISTTQTNSTRNISLYSYKLIATLIIFIGLRTDHFTDRVSTTVLRIFEYFLRALMTDLGYTCCFSRTG